MLAAGTARAQDAPGAARPMRRRRGGAEQHVPQVTKAPKLVHLRRGRVSRRQEGGGRDGVGAAGDRDRRRRQGRQRDRRSSRPAPTSTRRRWRRRKQFVFEPAEVDNKPAPVKINYRYAFAIKTQMVKLGPQVNFEGRVLERFTKKPMAGVAITLGERQASTRTDDDGPLRVHRRAARRAQGAALGATSWSPSPPTRRSRRTRRRRSSTSSRRSQEGIDEETVVRAARIKKESVQTVIRTEEARRVPGTQGDTLKVVQNLPGVARSALGSGALIVWGSAPRRHARQRRRRRDPRALSRGRAALDGELAIWCARSICCPAATAPSTGAASAAWCAWRRARCRKRACTATSRPTCSTPRRC